MHKEAGSLATPPADAARVASIRNSLDLKDRASIDSFGERARRDVSASIDRLISEVRTRDLIESEEILRNAVRLVETLDPADLAPRGLFSSRSGRLNRFRRRFDDATQSLDEFADDLKERADRLERKTVSLNTLHEQSRAFILELDAYLDAGRARLAEAVEPRLQEGVARLEERLGELERVRFAAIQQLPLVRIVQNVDGPVSDAVAVTLCRLERWDTDWSDRLGMNLERRARLRPDEVGLGQARAEFTGALRRLTETLAEARVRRAQVEEQMERISRGSRNKS